MKNITIRKDAELDIDDAYRWYETNKDGLGDKFLENLTESFRKMKEFPKIYPTVHRNIRRAFVRKFPYGIFYLESEESTIVVAVMHAKKNPTNWRVRI
mgnify:CR=1 FL=1